MMSIGSLFSGIGGLERGLELAGLGPVIWQAEADPFCRQVLARHWPGVRQYRDVREVGSDAQRPGIICGGYPCQGHSAVGRQLGHDDPRSALWGEFARVLRDLRPELVVVENVPALLRTGFGRVLGDLAALGYDALWDCLPASAVGAPHRRDRLFVVAWRAELAYTDGHRLEGRERARPAARDAATGGDLADRRRAAVERPSEFPPARADVQAWGAVPLATQPVLCRVAHGPTTQLDRARIRALGNAVIPAVARVIGEAIVHALEEAGP